MFALPSLQRHCLALSLALLGTAARRGGAQTPAAPTHNNWRTDAAGVGTTARVLIIGAHPDDEDNALIAWASLGRHVETAYLSLTRGENGVNLLGRERESLLSMVRTAEVLAERQRDGAHQYFTRAYDFGYARNDSVAYAAWPHDSLLRDVVTAIRAFRPHVVIALFPPDSTNRDGQHEVAGRLAREAFMVTGDTVLMPPRATSLIGPWTVGALYQMVDSSAPNALAIDVGELDRERAESYAEIGAEIRRLQRTQPQPPPPPVGAVFRYLRRDSVHLVAPTGDDAPSAAPPTSLFAGIDSGWTRFDGLALPDSTRAAIDSLVSALHSLSRGLASDAESVTAAHLGSIVRLATNARASLSCAEPAAQNCGGALGDLALALSTTRDRAARALLGASGVVVDATADREMVAQGDSVRATVAVYNGGQAPIVVRRVVASSEIGPGFASSDSAVIQPDSTGRWSGQLKIARVSYAGWLAGGLVDGLSIFPVPHSLTHIFNQRLVIGEDRIMSTDAMAMLRVGDANLTASAGPFLARDTIDLRGDVRHPVAGAPALNALLERGHEYAQAAVPFERLERAWVGSTRSVGDSVRLSIVLPAGLTADTAVHTVWVPPFGGRTVFFRVKGRWSPGTSSFSITAERVQPRDQPPGDHGAMREFRGAPVVTDGMVSFEYPHIPTQRLPVEATDSVRAVDLRYPANLRVAYVRSSRDDELDGRLAELGVPAYPIDPSQLGVADLTYYSTILIGARAFAQVEALAPNAPALRRFAERGGTVVVLYGRDELTAPGILPYPIGFGAPGAITALDPARALRVVALKSPLLTWPNRITDTDFAEWVGYRARELPSTFDPHYHPLVEMLDDDNHPTAAAVLSTRLGKGMFVYTALSLERQIVLATNPGAARLLVNLLCAGMARATNALSGG
ncbi:MAG: PIG-L family deacetylase [Gemmatimonadales bacterium]